MKPRYLPALVVLAALAFSGCESGRSARIQEKSAAYAMFSDELKARIAQGNVGVGDSADAVYIALGKPSSTSTRPSDQGEVTVWTYKNILVGEEMSSKISYAQPNQRYQGTPMKSGGGGRTGPSIVSTGASQGGPQGTVEATAETITLHVDLLDQKVVGLRTDR
jgi:hypothetical protein